MRIIILLIFFYATIINSAAQINYHYEIINKDIKSSFRGLSVVEDSVIWVSGSNGYIGRSTDYGVNFKFQQLAGYDSAEFRDIEAFDAYTAVVMSSVQPACILKTTNGGITWIEVFRNNDPVIFLDAIDFYKNNGICLGDPINGRFYLLFSGDNGDSWQIKKGGKTEAPDSLAAFAASGSVIQFIDEKKIIYATGGRKANLYISENKGKRWKIITSPVTSGSASRGIFSLCFSDEKFGIITGGDYLFPQNKINNFYVVTDVFGNNVKFKEITLETPGYISCVQIIDTDNVVVCGTNGVFVVDMKNNTSRKISDQGFHIIAASSAKIIYLAGADGNIAKLVAQ